MAMFLPWCDRSHFLLFVPSIGSHYRSFASSHGSAGRYFLPRELPIREGPLSRSLSMGFCVLFLWRLQRVRRDKEGEGDGDDGSELHTLNRFLVFLIDKIMYCLHAL